MLGGMNGNAKNIYLKEKEDHFVFLNFKSC